MNKSILTALLVSLVTITSAQTINKKLAVQLAAIDQADQQFRNKAVQANTKTKKEDAENMRKQGALDIANLAKVEAIFAKYGYPGKSMVGAKYQSVAFMVIQHNDAEAREKYLSLIQVAAEKGELRPGSVAIMVERSLTDKGKEQLYGSQMAETPTGVKIQPIADETNVNIRRAKVGLPPLEDYLKEWKISYKVPTATYQNPPEIYYRASDRPQAFADIIGGTESLYKLLTYPAAAKEKGISGYVTIELTIDKDGKLKNPQVVKSLGYGCDEEALRVVKEAKFTNPTGEDADMRIRFPFPGGK